MDERFIEYTKVLTDIKQLEKDIKFQVSTWSKSSIQPAYRCKDYNERTIVGYLPFDQLTEENFAPEKMKAFCDKITKYQQLRIQQSSIENKLEQTQAVEDINMKSIMNMEIGI